MNDSHQDKTVSLIPTREFSQQNLLCKLDYPLILVTNSLNGSNLTLGEKIREFSVRQIGLNKITSKFLGKYIGNDYEFAIISRDIPYELCDQLGRGICFPLDVTAKTLDILLHPEIKLNGTFNHRRIFSLLEDFEAISETIRKSVHLSAKKYAEKFALDNGFEIIVDRVSKGPHQYRVEDTKAYKIQRSITSSTHRPLGNTV